jgi:ABC-type Fe3+-hydroxamate transport system substrate-binding protein
VIDDGDDRDDRRDMSGGRAHGARRVVSLVPSLTETVMSFGVTPIACTKFCEQPTITHVGGTKDPDIARIVALRPDVVLMDREENRREDAEALADSGVDVWATHVVSVGDVATMMSQLRLRLGVSDSADPATRSPAAPPQIPARRQAFVAIWRRPWMTISARTYGSSLLASIGIGNVFAGHESDYPVVTLDEVSERSPHLVLLPSEPYPFKQRHVAELARALPSAEIRLIDGQDLFWWGARTDAAAGRLSQSLESSSP